MSVTPESMRHMLPSGFSAVGRRCVVQRMFTLFTVMPVSAVRFITYTPAGRPSVASAGVTSFLLRTSRPLMSNISMSPVSALMLPMPSVVVLLTLTGTYMSAAPREESFTYASCTPISSELNDTVNEPPVAGSVAVESLNLLLLGPPNVRVTGSTRLAVVTFTSSDTASLP